MIDNISFAISIAVALFFLGVSIIFVVQQQTVVIVERFGKFQRIAFPGLNIKIPFIESIRCKISLRIRQLDVEVETKTKDNVFITIMIAVQYNVLSEKVYEAFYMLQDPVEQIKAFVFDLVRAQVPLMNLDDVFSRKDDVADAIKNELEATMSSFGYEIMKALVTDINPDPHVKAAMNEINTAQRLRVAATERGEADKILKVKQAEAEAEASILQGKGIAGQRQAIIEGLSQSVDEFVKHNSEIRASSVMDMVLLIQYIDTLRDIGANSKSNVVFVPHSPGNLSSISDQLRETIFSSEMLKESVHNKK